MVTELQQKLGGWLVELVAPALIMLMTGSLTFFMMSVCYYGDNAGRVGWVLSLFIFASVLVSRISIVEGFDKATLYGVVLGGATLFVLTTLSNFPLLMGMIFIGGIWWFNSKLTWDCTVLDQSRDSTDRGLLSRFGVKGDSAPVEESDEESESHGTSSTEEKKQSAWTARFLGRKKVANTPGVWVLILSLAAFPIFGIGQGFIGEEVRRQNAFFYFCTYLAAGLGLLVTTAMMGLQRYLQKRNATMPNAVAISWVVAGGLMIVAILVGAWILPRPYSEYSVAKNPFKFEKTSNWGSSKYSVGNEGKDDGRSGGQQDQNSKSQGGDSQSSKDQSSEKSANNKQGNSSGSSNSDSTSGSGKSKGKGKGKGEDKSKSKSKGKSDSKGGGSNSKSKSGKSGDSKSDSSKAGNPVGQKGAKPNSDQSKNSGSKQQSDKDQKSSSENSKSQKNDSQAKNSSDPNSNQRSKSDPNQGQSPNQKDQSDSKSKRGKQRDPNGNKSNENRQTDNNQGKSGNSKSSNRNNSDSNKQNSQSSSTQSSPTSSSPRLTMQMPGFAGILWIIQVLFWVVIIVVAVFLLWKYRTQVLESIRKFIADLKDFWANLWSKKPKEESDANEVSQELKPQKALKPFSQFSNPFDSNRDLPADSLVRYTFEAVEAWGRERGVSREEDQTPHEFAVSLVPLEKRVAKGAKKLADFYCEIAFAKKNVDPKQVRSEMQLLWAAMSRN